MDISLLCCGVSMHLTNIYNDSYNETHESIGMYVEEGAWGAEYFHFNDSFDESSDLMSVNYRWQAYNWLKLGAGAGYVNTSYYEGALVLPLVEIEPAERVGLQFSAFPPMYGSEALIMGQLKVKFYIGE